MSLRQGTGTLLARLGHGLGTRRGAALAALAALLLGLVREFLQPASPDVAWLLYVARLVGHGARYGVDVIEVNPPLIVWIKVPLVLLADRLGVADALVFRLFAMAVTGLSLALGWRLVTPLACGREPGDRRRILLGYACTLWLFPLMAFGQREHLALALTLPLLCLVAGRAEGVRHPNVTAGAVGVLAGIGVALKPHFLGLWVAVEAVYLVRRWTARQPVTPLRAENLAIGLTGLWYLLLVQAVNPEYFALVRRLGALYHQFLHNGTLSTVLRWESAVPLFALAAYPALKNTGPERSALPAVLWVATAGFYAGAVVQHKGFWYHFFPAQQTGWLMLWVLSWGRARPVSGIRLVYARLGVATLAGTLLLAAVRGTSRDGPGGGVERADSPRQFAEMVRRVRAEAEGEPVMVLSTTLASTVPLLPEAGAIIGSRYPCLWMLAALYHNRIWRQGRGGGGIVAGRPFAERTGLEREVGREVVADLKRYRPRLVLVMKTDPRAWGLAGSRRFDYLAYFGADPEFTRLWAQYREVGLLGGYRIFRRMPAAQGTPGLPRAAG